MEHEHLNLSCTATVGSPQGSIALWTKNETSSTWEQRNYISDVQNYNCIYIATFTKTYNLTRQDNGTMFRCSSQNNYTKYPALTTDIGPIKVLCKSCFLDELVSYFILCIIKFLYVCFWGTVLYTIHEFLKVSLLLHMFCNHKFLS